MPVLGVCAGVSASVQRRECLCLRVCACSVSACVSPRRVDTSESPGPEVPLQPQRPSVPGGSVLHSLTWGVAQGELLPLEDLSGDMPRAHGGSGL